MNDYDDTTTITYEDLVRDPALVERLHRRAMRLRSVEGARALREGARALFDALTPADGALVGPAVRVSQASCG